MTEQRLSVPFTQYLRPNGHKKPITITVIETTAQKARTVLNRGWRFEAEVLQTGEVSLTVTDGEDDLVIEVVQNGPAVLDAVQRLIEAAEAIPAVEKPKEK